MSVYVCVCELDSLSSARGGWGGREGKLFSVFQNLPAASRLSALRYCAALKDHFLSSRLALLGHCAHTCAHTRYDVCVSGRGMHSCTQMQLGPRWPLILVHLENTSNLATFSGELFSSR